MLYSLSWVLERQRDHSFEVDSRLLRLGEPAMRWSAWEERVVRNIKDGVWAEGDTGDSDVLLRDGLQAVAKDPLVR